MSAREHSIDRVAHAMTSGAPGKTFTTRVMSPLRGVPQLGFTARVMSAIELAPRERAVVMRALGLALATAAALAIVAALWRPGKVALPAIPDPTLVNAHVGEPSFTVPVIIQRPPVTPRRGARDGAAVRPVVVPNAELRAPAAVASAAPERPPYRIAQLEPPADLAIRAIEPGRPSVGPLTPPAALIVSQLKLEKDKS